MANFMTTKTEFDGILRSIRDLEEEAGIQLANICKTKGEEGMATSALEVEIKKLLSSCNNDQSINILINALVQLSTSFVQNSSDNRTSMFDEISGSGFRSNKNKKTKSRKDLW